MDPFIITLTYILFNCSSALLFGIMTWAKNFISFTAISIYISAISLLIIGWSSDAIIYSSLQKDVNAMLSKLFINCLSVLLRKSTTNILTITDRNSATGNSANSATGNHHPNPIDGEKTAPSTSTQTMKTLDVQQLNFPSEM